MKTFQRIIFFLIFFCKHILCQENIDKIFDANYYKMKELPVGSTIYYTRNIKCASYNTNSSICLINGDLYNSVGSNYHPLITTISDYSNSFYYELNIYNETDKEKMNCIITHFVNENELIFKYYSINIVNNSFNTKDFPNYNISFNPLNRGINCHTRDMDYKFTCFYLNKNKKIIKIEIIYMNESDSVSATFQIFNTQISSLQNINNMLIMSSLYNNKFKFFSCFHFNGSDSFNAYANDAPPNDNTYNNFNTFIFKCENKEKMILFSVFNFLFHISFNYKNNFNS